MRLGAGHPCLNHVVFGVLDLQGCARQLFVAVGDVGLADLHLRDRIFDQDDRVAIGVSGLLPCRGHCAVGRHSEGNVGYYQIAVRCDSLAQRVFNACLQALDQVAAVVLGHPLVNDLLFRILNNQVCSRNFLAVGDVGLLNFYVDGLVVHYQDGLALVVCARRAAAGHIAVLVNAEDSIAGNRISVGSQRLTQRVFNARLQPFNYFRLFAGHPFLHDVFVLVQDLQRRAGQLFIALGDVALAYGDVGLAVVYDQDLNAVLVLADRAGAGHLAGFSVDGEDGLAGDRIAVRSDGLNQLVLYAGLQAFHIVRFGTGDPGLDDLVFRIQDLHGRTRQFLLIGDIDLADLHLRDGVFNQDDSALGHSAGSRYLTGCVDHKGGFCSDRVAQRRDGLLQGVGLAGRQALHFMDVLRGGPLFNDLAVLVDDLDMRAFQLFTVSNVNLVDLHFGNAVRNGVSPFVTGHLGDYRSLISGNLSFAYRILDFSIVIKLDQVRPGILPAILCIQLNSISKILAVCLQLDHYLFRPAVVLVVIVIPDLLNRNVCRLQRICNTGSADNFVETGNLFFFNCVVDSRLAVCAVLRQILGRECPLAVGAGLHRQGVDGLVAVLDVNRDLLGQQFGAVALQVPDLLAADLCQFRNVDVCNVVVGNYLTEAGRHFFIHRVGDGVLRALLVLRQVAGRELPLVVLAGLDSQRLNCVVALLDIDRDALGHEACVIALHIPGLFTGDLHGLQRVGNAGALGNLLEARDRFFVSRVDDLGLSVCAVLRQILGRECPLAVGAGLHRQGVDGLVAVLDVNRDLLGQQFGAVALQVPDLLAADLCQFRNVDVCNVVVGNYLTEAGRHFFIHRVGDGVLRALLVLRQVAGRELPLVVLAGLDSQRLNCVVALLDIDRDALGHEACVIALHIPGLFAGDLHGLQRVGNLRPVKNLLKSGHRFFIDGIVDQCLTVSAILRQILGSEAPSSFRARPYLKGFNSLIAVLDIDCDLFRQQFWAVALQLPGLLAPDFSCLQIVCDVIAVNTFFESVRNLFIDGVIDQCCAVSLIHREFSGRVFPIVIFPGDYIQCINNLCTVLDIDCNACRDIAGISTSQVPCLMAADSGRLQGILHSVCEASIRCFGDFGRVVRNCVFGDRVINVLTTGLLRQAVPLKGPVIFLIQFDGRCLCTVSQQVDSHAGRTITVPVVAVFPNLGHFDLRLFGCMGICDGVREGSVSSLCNLRRVVGYCVFRNRIVNSSTVGILVQIGPGMCPAVACIQLNGTNLCTVSQQVDRNAGQTIAILVVGVFPLLRNRNLGLLRCMAVGQGSDRTISGSIR